MDSKKMLKRLHDTADGVCYTTRNALESRVAPHEQIVSITSSMIERRRLRRAELQEVGVIIRSADAASDASLPESPEDVVIGQLKNVSLAGAYCYVKAPCRLKAGEHIRYSISVPPDLTRRFPFTRLTGNGWIVRVEPIPRGRRMGETSSENELLGLALAFSSDVTALATAHV